MPALDLTTAHWRKSTRSSDSNTCVEITFAQAEWRKSTHSEASNTCVEVTFTTAGWRKSTHSTNTSNCLEVAFTGPAVALRDSKNPTGPTLALPAPSFTTLLRTV